MIDITTIGEILIDLTQSGRTEQGIPRFDANPGGAPANLAVAAARLGARTATLEAAKTAKASGAYVSYDPNYRASLWPDEETAVRNMTEPLSMVDILKVSDEELPLLTGCTDPEKGSARLAEKGVRLVLVTLGAHGAFYRFDGHTGHVPGVPCQVGDTNGSGDTFFGAALSQLVKLSSLDQLTVPELERILAFANKAASITTSRHGAIPAMPTLEEVLG